MTDPGEEPEAEAGAGLPVFRRIHAVLAEEIAAGRYPSGQMLPSEAELARRFGVNRHTLRRALALLAEAGAIHVRRGAGAMVTARRLPYPLGPRTRFGANLAAAGAVPGHLYLRLETLPATEEEAAALGLPPGAPVHVGENVGLADGVPVSLAASTFPAARFPDLLRDLPETHSVTASFARAGVMDYSRAWTRAMAVLADPIAARHLRVAEGAPLLRTVSLNVDTAGRAVEYGRTLFVSDRLEIHIDGTGLLPDVDRTGLPPEEAKG